MVAVGGLCGDDLAPLEAMLPLLPDESILRRALETEDADLLFSSIWTLDPGHTGYRLWRPPMIGTGVICWP